MTTLNCSVCGIPLVKEELYKVGDKWLPESSARKISSELNEGKMMGRIWACPIHGLIPGPISRN